jgi:hypothetical protein
MALKVAQRCAGISYFPYFFGGRVLREKSPLNRERMPARLA